MSVEPIPYGRQSMHPDDLEAIGAMLFSDWLTTGPQNDAFEHAVAARVGARHAITFSSATSALHGACHVAGLGAGDVVHTTPLTFMASANCARYVGARPALIDIDASTYNIDVAGIGEGVDALVPVHYAGLPVALGELSHRPRVVIEDASHALGALTPDGPVGNCAHSDMCVFSFHPVKPITTGEGGMITTNDDDLAARLRRFRSQGIDRTPHADAWMYDAVEVGYNYRMTDIQAALGISQLGRLDHFLARHNEIADRYRDRLAHLPIVLPPAAPAGYLHGYHLFAIRVENRSDVFRQLREASIGVQVHYVPVHHHTVSADIELPPEGMPVCDEVYSGLISMPMFPDLTDAQQDRVVRVLEDILGTS
jgi:dTDP-4-amino-4,6-dideoxygalactose transaminase